MLHCHASRRGSGNIWARWRGLRRLTAALAVALSLPWALLACQDIPAATAPQMTGPQSQMPWRPLQVNPSSSERQMSGSRSGPILDGGLEHSRDMHAAAALEMDYNGSYYGQGGRRSTGQSNSPFWEDGVGTSSAWYILAWVWLCGALIAALVFLTYRRLAHRQMQEPTTASKTSSLARHSNTPPPSVNAAPADPWRRNP